MLIVAADIGKFQTRIVTQNYRNVFPSKLFPYRALRLENNLAKNDFIIDYGGKRFLGGDLGIREGEFPIQYTDESKAHMTTLINLLCGLHQLPNSQFQVVLGTPISHKTDKEKQLIKEMVKGSHTINVNGKNKLIMIEEVEIAAEGASGYWSQPVLGEVQGFDFGSTTINFFTMLNKSFIDKRSGTFPFGAENSLTKDKAAIMESVYSQLANKFQEGLPTMVMGGHAYEMINHVKRYYPKAYLIEDPIFATALGFYEIARARYE